MTLSVVDVCKMEAKSWRGPPLRKAGRPLFIQRQFLKPIITTGILMGKLGRCYWQPSIALVHISDPPRWAQFSNRLH